MRISLVCLFLCPPEISGTLSGSSVKRVTARAPTTDEAARPCGVAGHHDHRAPQVLALSRLRSESIALVLAWILPVARELGRGLRCGGDWRAVAAYRGRQGRRAPPSSVLPPSLELHGTDVAGVPRHPRHASPMARLPAPTCDELHAPDPASTAGLHTPPGRCRLCPAHLPEVCPCAGRAPTVADSPTYLPVAAPTCIGRG